MKQKELVRDIFKTTALVIAGKSVGFLVPFIIGALFGISGDMDAFFFTYGLLFYISIIFSSTIAMVIVPYVAEARSTGGDIGKFVGSLLVSITLLILLLSLIIIPLLHPVLGLVTQFNKESLRLIFVLYIEMIPLVLLIVYAGVFDGILNAYKKFDAPALSPALRAVVLIVVMFLFQGTIGIHAIVLGYITGELFRLAVLVVMVKINKLFTFRFSFFPDVRLKEFFRKAGFQLIGVLSINLNSLIDKTMASWLDEGSVSILYYGDRLFMVPANIIMTGLGVALLSHWSEQYYSGEKNRLRHQVNRTALRVCLVIIPPLLLLMFFHRELAMFVFGFSNFSDHDILLIARVFFLYVIGLLPYVASQIYARGHIVMKKTRIIMIGSLLLSCLNVCFNVVFMNIIGVEGLALSTSIVSVAGFIFFILTFRYTH
ncbi:MAG: oligosaccharide flippase family protein [Spirochaetales bacterium]|nr:oligosaccharide flippase family protein [Spirochaetales bacterium]